MTPGRIAFLANPDVDFLQDVVFHGLASILGPENVVEYPPLERYRSPPPPDASHPHLWFHFPEPERVPLRELVASADAVVIGSLRRGVRAAVEEALALDPRPPVAFLDGDDGFYVLAVRSRVDVYCKREVLLPGTVSGVREALRRTHRLLRKHAEARDPLLDPVAVARSRDRRLVPLPFAWVGPLPERRAVEYDVAFLGSLTSPERFVMRAGLDRLEAEGARVRTLQKGESLPWASYVEILARSRIAVSVRGSGFDTYRYWEIPAAGALLLAETPRIVIPGNFVDGREAVFAPVGELASRARELLERDTEEVAAAGRARLEAAHTSVHRAQVVLDALAAL